MNLQRISKLLEEDNSLIIRQTILDKAQEKNQIIHGARAINKQVPTYLKSETSDYDVLTKRPKKSAKEITLELNRRVGRDEFKVIPAKHKGTFKVKDSKGNTVADYTQLKRTPKVKNSWGNKYYDLKSIKQNIQRRLKDPKKEFRREKDSLSLHRIKLSEKNFDF